MDHLRSAFAFKTIGDVGVEKKGCSQLRMVQQAKHQPFLEGVDHAWPVGGAIVEMREEKDAGEVRWRRSSGAERKRIQIEIHKEDVAGRKSASVLFHQFPMECRNRFEFRADPSKIGVSRIQ